MRILESISFLQNKNWLRKQDLVYKTSLLVRISFFNQRHKKEFLLRVFFLGEFSLQKQWKTYFL